MRVGVCYNVEYHPDIHKSPSHYYGQILDQVDLMEELGYDTVWFSEHHCAGYSFGNPAVIAAAVAARTKRIRIGTGVSLLPLHHPILLAEQYGMLDVLSNGRLEYGVGRGYLMQEYDWLKVPIDESHSRYREAAEFIIKAWTEPGPISFHGEHFDVDNYSYFPQPVQRPHPPIYASAAGTQASFEWAAAMGLNLGTALFGPPLEMIRDNVQLYRRELRAHGFDPATREVCAITQMYCAEDQDEAEYDGDIFSTNYYRFFAQVDASARVSTVPSMFEEVRGRDLNKDNRVLLGNPENLRTRISDLRDDIGIDLLLMEVAQGGAPTEKVFSALELFGKEVLPHLQATNHTKNEALNDEPLAAQ
ncbi:MAG: LLM class flavin-dependent oxidoreductase [Burkholderiales bacterium]|nr:MAG: LLM class flavin-dependent oxidoreductase [Burkholderiales bacterium]